MRLGAQMQSVTKMQIQMMDQMMDAWEEQIKSPNPIPVPRWQCCRSQSPCPASARPALGRTRTPGKWRRYHAVLDTTRRAVAESLGRRDGVLGQSRQAR